MGSIENHANVGNQTVIQIQNMSGSIGIPYVVIPQQISTTHNAPNTTFTLNTDYYNLFVIGTETFSDGHFIVPKDRALTESMTPENKAQFSALSDEAIARIRTFPSIFASENHYYGKTDEDHQAIFGYVKEVRIQDNGIDPAPDRCTKLKVSQSGIMNAKEWDQCQGKHSRWSRSSSSYGRSRFYAGRARQSPRQCGKAISRNKPTIGGVSNMAG